MSTQKDITSLLGQISPKGLSTPAYSSLNASFKRIKLFPTTLTISQNITEKYLMETILPLSSKKKSSIQQCQVHNAWNPIVLLVLFFNQAGRLKQENITHNEESQTNQ